MAVADPATVMVIIIFRNLRQLVYKVDFVAQQGAPSDTIGSAEMIVASGFDRKLGAFP